MKIKDIIEIINENISDYNYSISQKNEIGYLVLYNILQMPLLKSKYKNFELYEGFDSKSDITIAHSDYGNIDGFVSTIGNGLSHSFYVNDSMKVNIPFKKDIDLLNDIKIIIEKSNNFYEYIDNIESNSLIGNSLAHKSLPLYNAFKYYKCIKDDSDMANPSDLVGLYPFSFLSSQSSIYSFSNMFKSEECIKDYLTNQTTLLRNLANIDGFIVNQDEFSKLSDFDNSDTSLLSILLQNIPKEEILKDVFQKYFNIYKDNTLSKINIKMMASTYEEILSDYPIVGKITDKIVNKFPYIETSPEDLVKKFILKGDDNSSSQADELKKYSSINNGIGLSESIESVECFFEDYNRPRFKYVLHNPLDILLDIDCLSEKSKNNGITYVDFLNFNVKDYLDKDFRINEINKFITYLKENEMAVSLDRNILKKKEYELFLENKDKIIIVDKKSNNWLLKESLVKNIDLNYNEFLKAQNEIDSSSTDLDDENVINSIINKYKITSNKLKT